MTEQTMKTLTMLLDEIERDCYSLKVDDWERTRVLEFVKDPEVIFNVKLTDLMLHDRIIATLFKVGGMKWLNAVMKVASTRQLSGVPIRFTNTLNDYNETGKIIPSMDFASMIRGSLIDPLECIGEEKTLEHLLNFFVIGDDGKLNVEGKEILLSHLNEQADSPEHQYRYSERKDNTVILLSDWIDDVTSKNFK